MDNNKLLVPMSIVIAGVIIAGAIVYQPNRQPGDSEYAGAPEQPTITYETPTVDDDVVLGDVNAPVTIIEFGDFECPFCKRLHDEVGTQLREEYIKTGKVKMVYRDYPLSFHPNAMPAAEAAECAGEQGKYWQYHDALFDRQDTLSSLNYVALATELGLNATQFKTCVDTHKYADEITKDLAAGNAAGVDGTPATFINGQLVSGAVPYATIKSVIEAALAN